MTLSTREKLAVLGVRPETLTPGDMARLASDLGVSRQRVHQILKQASREHRPHKLDGLLPPGMSRARLAEEAGLSYRWLTQLIRPGPPASQGAIAKWAPRIAAVLRQPADVVAARLEGGSVRAAEGD